MSIYQEYKKAETTPFAEQDLRLVKQRVRIYPTAVTGSMRRIKWAVLIACLGIYYLLPWLRWDRGPGRPDQAFLLDIWHERMYVLGWEFWPQEIYLLAGALILGTLVLFMVTSLVGRVWCGYACPQTVWTDLFLFVERLIEGDRNARMKRDAQPMSFDKAWRKIAKHTTWLAIAFWTGGAWIMYYVDAPTVTHDFWTGTASAQVYFFIGLFTATTYLLAGWAREQVCTYMCPWPRFQATMLDEQTLTVTYQAARGEPRREKHLHEAHSHEAGERFGQCVDCHSCVNACPMGIDIRDGQQLECISCGLCIDACNGVMTKLKQPRGLISWDNLVRQTARSQGAKILPAISFARPRTLIYLLILLCGSAGFSWALANRGDLSLTIQRDRAPLFVRLSDGSLRNGYTLSLINKQPVDRKIEVTLTGLDGVELSLPESAGHKSAGTAELVASADTVTDIRVLVSTAARVRGSVPVSFVLVDPVSGQVQEWKSTFVGPAAPGGF